MELVFIIVFYLSNVVISLTGIVIALSLWCRSSLSVSSVHVGALSPSFVLLLCPPFTPIPPSHHHQSLHIRSQKPPPHSRKPSLCHPFTYPNSAKVGGDHGIVEEGLTGAGEIEDATRLALYGIETTLLCTC